MFRKIIAVLLLTLFTSACAQKAAMFSNPPGARVTIDGEEVGITPCDFRYKTSAGSSYEVTVEKEGYEPVHETVSAEEWDCETRNKWLKAGVVWSPLWIGTLFARKLKDSYEFVLKELGSTPTRTAMVDGEKPSSPN